jgi:hypothetical protein
VPPWDFDAPDGEAIRDSSAAMPAAVGLLHLHACLIGKPLAGQGSRLTREDGYDGRFLEVAIRITEETIDLCLDRDLASFAGSEDEDGQIPVRASAFDGILRHATAQNCPHAFKQVAGHGSVYADYFLLEFGNLLLKLEDCKAYVE